MHRDVKEIVGCLMRVIGGGDISRDEVMALSFEADGELEAALNEAYIRLLEFAHDAEVLPDEAVRSARYKLNDYLDKILEACDRQGDAMAGRSAREIVSRYQFIVYDSGVEFTVVWPTEAACAAAKQTLADAGVHVIEGAMRGCAFVMIETAEQRDVLRGLSHRAEEEKRGPS